MHAGEGSRGGHECFSPPSPVQPTGEMQQCQNEPNNREKEAFTQ
jgi:hypothetical protein